jgi:hypothetical protein
MFKKLKKTNANLQNQVETVGTIQSCVKIVEQNKSSFEFENIVQFSLIVQVQLVGNINPSVRKI